MRAQISPFILRIYPLSSNILKIFKTLNHGMLHKYTKHICAFRINSIRIIAPSVYILHFLVKFSIAFEVKLRIFQVHLIMFFRESCRSYLFNPVDNFWDSCEYKLSNSFCFIYTIRNILKGIFKCKYLIKSLFPCLH